MRKALLVGINQYPNSPLRGCINDSNAVKEALELNGDSTKNFDVLQKNDVVSKCELKSYIKECFNGDSEIALFYYSGHGAVDQDGTYLVTPDAQEYDCGISLDEIMKIVNMSKCRNKILIIDACYSGNLGNINGVGQNTAVLAEGVSILTACRDYQYSVEEDGHGIFTTLFVEALNGGAADILGNITLGGIYAFIDKSLGAWDQRPVFKTNITTFAPVKKVIPQVSLDIIRKIKSIFSSPDIRYSLNPSFEPTNALDVKHEVIEPYAQEDNVMTFKALQKLESIGLVKPCGTPHMYYAAMESKACELTTTGKYYWELLNKNMI